MGAGSEPDLVVDNNVNHATDSVRYKVRELQRLRHYPLAAEGRITVNKNAEHGVFPARPCFVLHGPRAAHDNRINHLRFHTR